MTRLFRLLNSCRKLKTFVLLIVSAIAYADGPEKNMISGQNSLWKIITEIEKQMPISVNDAEKTLGISFTARKNSEYFILLSGQGRLLDEGVSITEANLMLSPSLEFDQRSALGLEIDGQCVSLTEIRKRFSELKLVQAPRGRSLQETTVWSSTRNWGFITFAFKEEKPLCLSSVSFRMHEI